MQIGFVQKEQVEQVWNHVEPMLEKATYVYPGYTAADIKQALLEGRHHLWVVAEEAQLLAAFTTAIHQFPSAKVVECVHIGGEGIEAWIGLVSKLIEDFAKTNECTSTIMTGRPGFEKVATKYGFTKTAVFLRRDA